jgi:hypothetical protein
MAVYHDEPALQILHGHRNGGIVHEAPHAGFAFAQRPLGLFALGDVLSDAADSHDAAVGIAHGKAHGERIGIAAHRGVAVLEHDGHAARQYLVILGDEPLGERRRVDLRRRLAADLRSGHALKLLDGAIHQLITQIRVLQVHREGRMIEEPAQARLAVAQRGLGALALGDVLERAARRRPPPARGALDLADLLDPDDFAIGPQDPEFGGEGIAARLHFGVEAPEGIAIRGMDEGAVARIAHGQIGIREPQRKAGARRPDV